MTRSPSWVPFLTPFLVGRVRLLKSTTEKRDPYSSLSTGGPRSTCTACDELWLHRKLYGHWDSGFFEPRLQMTPFKDILSGAFACQSCKCIRAAIRPTRVYDWEKMIRSCSDTPWKSDPSGWLPFVFPLATNPTGLRFPFWNKQPTKQVLYKMTVS